MDYILDEKDVEILKAAYTYSGQVEVKGAANVGNLFQAIVRLEAVLQKLLEQNKNVKSNEGG